MDPHEDLQVGALFGWTAGPILEVVQKYKGNTQEVSEPPGGNLPHPRPNGMTAS
jgi:hypothetical protein